MSLTQDAADGRVAWQTGRVPPLVAGSEPVHEPGGGVGVGVGVGLGDGDGPGSGAGLLTDTVASFDTPPGPQAFVALTLA